MDQYVRYPEYRDSEIDWIQNIPTHWDVKKLKFLFRRMERPVRDIDEIVTAFRDGYVTLRKNRRIEGFTNAIKEHGYQGVRQGDLVIHAMDGFAGAIGVSDSDGKCSPVYSVCAPLKANKVNAEFYGRLLRNMALSGFVTALAKGIRERSTEFRYSEAKEVLLPVPDKEEQDSIVRFLDHETAKIDQLIAKQKRLIELLKEKRQAVISHAVTKGLNPDAPMKDSGVEWLGEVPAHWGCKKLKYFALLRGGGTPSKENLDYWNGDIPWVSPKDMKRFYIDDAEDKITLEAVAQSSTNLISPGNTLIVVRSGILQRTIPVAINNVSVALNQDMKAIDFKNEKISEFFSYYIYGFEQQLLLAWRKQGATVESIEHEYLANSIFYLPPPKEMREILQFIKQHTSTYDSLVSKAQEAITLLKEHRSALISAAVTGKIDVRNWKPESSTETERQVATA